MMRISILIFFSVTAFAQVPSPSPEPDLIRLLEERIAKLEAKSKEAEARLQETPVISFGPTGMVLRTPDGKTTIQTRGLVQADGRAFLDDDSHSLTDTFLLRRVRPSIDATFFGWLDARIMPDFGQNKAYVVEAYVDLRPWKWLALQGGKFKPPVGLERLQTEASTKFVERALPTNLVPSRDVGVMLHGNVFVVDYQIGVFNGVVDGAEQPDTDSHDGKELAARIWFHPFKRKWLANLGFGVSGTFGEEHGNAAQTNVAGYKTPGQNTFFSYLSDTSKADGYVRADGDRWRVSPQLYYFGGPAGLMLEYARSSQDLKKGNTAGTVWSDAWQVQLSFLLTPHDQNSYDNVVITHPLEWHNRGYGAFELVLRYHEQHIEQAAFPVFADPNKSAHLARAFGLGLNWYANRFFRAAVNYDRTDFEGGAKGGDRAPENALMGRLQAMF